MDFLLGIICGVLGYAIVAKYKEDQVKKNSPKRGRPPKRINIDDTPDDHKQ